MIYFFKQTILIAFLSEYVQELPIAAESMCGVKKYLAIPLELNCECTVLVGPSCCCTPSFRVAIRLDQSDGVRKSAGLPVANPDKNLLL